MEMGQMADIVNQERADRTALIPARIKHEMVENQLAVPVEEVKRTVPLDPSKRYALSILTMGSLRRSALSRSRARVASFSLMSSSARKACHSFRETMGGQFITFSFGVVIEWLCFSASALTWRVRAQSK